MRRRRALPKPLANAAAVLAALALLLAGCQSSTGPAGSTPATTTSPQTSQAAFPRDVDVYGTTLHLDARPERIVILGPSMTETAFAIGAGDQVTAVDKLSDYPAAAPTSDLDAFKPNAEAIVKHDPDLVLITNDQDKIVEALRKLKVPVALLPAPQDLKGALAQFALVGELTGHEDGAATVSHDVQSKVDDAIAKTKNTKASYYWELDPTYYTVTSKTFVGSILAQLGLTNIADKAPDAAGGYPKLSSEYIIDADPDLIFLADTVCCRQNAAAVKKRPGWDVTRAVKDPDGVVAINDDIASRWGPRIGDLAESVAAAVQQVQ